MLFVIQFLENICDDTFEVIMESVCLLYLYIECRKYYRHLLRYCYYIQCTILFVIDFLINVTILLFLIFLVVINVLFFSNLLFKLKFAYIGRWSVICSYIIPLFPMKFLSISVYIWSIIKFVFVLYIGLVFECISGVSPNLCTSRFIFEFVLFVVSILKSPIIISFLLMNL